MGHKKDGLVELFTYPQKLLLELVAKHRVKCTKWFIHKEQRRIHGQGAGKAYPLLLATGEFPGIAVHEEFRRELDKGKEVPDPLLQKASGHPCQCGYKPYVARNGQVGKKADVLDNIPDITPQIDRVKERDILTIDKNPSFIGLNQTIDHPEHGCLATSGRTDQNEKLTGIDFQIEMVYCSDWTIPFGNTLEPDTRSPLFVYG
jgi:hypothetical protein